MKFKEMYEMDMTGLADETGTTEKDVDPKELKMGIEVEMEHTKDKSVAKQIALDHLAEDPKYYTKLKEIDPHHESVNEGLKEDLISFLKDNQNPSDDEVHEWAEKKN